MKEYGSYSIQKEPQFKRFKPRNNVFKLVLTYVETEPKWKACSESIKELTTVIQLAGEEDMKEDTGYRNVGGGGMQIRKGRIKRPHLYYDEDIGGYGFGTCRTVQTIGSLRVASCLVCHLRLII